MGSPQSGAAVSCGVKFKIYSKSKGFEYILNLIQEAKLFKNTNLVVEPEFTSGEATQLGTKFDLGSNLNGYIPKLLQT